MKKKITFSVAVSLIVMFLLPWLAVSFAGGNDALGILLILIFILNPLVSIGIGIASGRVEKVEWYLPLVNAVIFLASACVIIGFDITYILCTVIYFVIGIAAAYITSAIKHKRK